jgi:adenylate kinase
LSRTRRRPWLSSAIRLADPIGPPIPGAGKGTQGQLLAEHLGVTHISTGELLREAADEESLVGFQARVFMDSGRLVPDKVVMDVLAARVEALDVSGRGCVFDGVPRTAHQARLLDEMLGAGRVDVVIELVVSESAAMARLLQRSRDDDSVAALRQRFVDYEAQTPPLLAYYEPRGPVWRIDGEGSPGTVAAEINERFAVDRHLRRDAAQ